MQLFDPPCLMAILQRILPVQASDKLCVAYSGGMDSSVLLHALARSMTTRGRYQLRAIYVDHQLHPQSQQWQAHCAAVCRALDIDYQPLTVMVRTEPGISVEAAARDARYAALAGVLASEETLLTAHHADDQLETVLLALLRGSGIKGLAAMPPVQRFGPGWHARPLLEYTRASLHEWAQAAALTWVSDPTNAGVRFDRNYLRHEVLPRLQKRWPAAALSVSRSATHAAEAEGLLEQLASADAATAIVESCLRVSHLTALSGPRRRNLLRHWLRRCHASMPATRKLAALEHDMLTARADRQPCIEWDRFAVRRHRDLLYCTPREMPLPCRPSAWDWSTPLSLGALGELQLVSTNRGGLAPERLPTQLSVTFRPEAERMLGAERGQQRKLKRLLQRAAVLPWCREQVPLIVSEGWLVAVGDWWVSENFAAAAGAAGLCIEWRGAPTIRAVQSSVSGVLPGR